MPRTKTAKQPKPRLGRPPLPPGEARDGWLRARVPPHIEVEVAEVARAEGIDASEVVRRAVSAYLVARKMPSGE